MRGKLAVAALVAACAGGCTILVGPDGLALRMMPIYASIGGTGIRVVTNAESNVFHYHGSYYRWWGGRWWRSPTWRSGWTPISIVPREFLHIPRTHPSYHVVRHHPQHPSHSSRPAPVVRPTYPTRPTPPSRPVVRPVVRNAVRDAAKERAKREKEKREWEKKEKEKRNKPKRGRR